MKRRLNRVKSGDSYIFLHTYKRPGGKALLHDLYFWIGKRSSQDEYGTAAFMTVILDDALGGKPVQHREVQGHESKQFLALFKSPRFFHVVRGGKDSAFRHVEEEEFEPRLLQVKGKVGAVQVVQTAELAAKEMNQGDCFVLDATEAIYVWVGAAANVGEKLEARKFARELMHDRSGDVPVHDVESDGSPAFWKALKGGPKAVQSAKAGGDDADLDALLDAVSLLRVTDDTVLGRVKVKEIAKGRTLKRAMLDSNDAMVINSLTRTWVWIGADATQKEKDAAPKRALRFQKKEKLPPLPITVVQERGEPDEFWGVFVD